MKKLVVMTFLAIGTFGFANASAGKKFPKVKNTVACCTVGGYTVCGDISDAGLCAAARSIYCVMTRRCGGGGGGCIAACGGGGIGGSPMQ